MKGILGDDIQALQLRKFAAFVHGSAGHTDDEAGWEKALRDGVTVFRTNRPKELIRFLKKRKRRNW